MKVARVVAEFLKSVGVRHVFAISGGASLHLIHGIADTEGIEYVCPQHEQAGGFMADSYSRINGIGCAIGTSGPGFTNLITPIAVSYADSIPVFYIVGNTATNRINTHGTRQIGFQFTPTVEMIRPITKYAETVMKPENIRNCLLQAYSIMMDGRRGPVLIDIPDDIQRADA